MLKDELLSTKSRPEVGGVLTDDRTIGSKVENSLCMDLLCGVDTITQTGKCLSTAGGNIETVNSGRSDLPGQLALFRNFTAKCVD